MLNKIIFGIILISFLSCSSTSVIALELEYDYAFGYWDYFDYGETDHFDIYKRGADDALGHVQETVDEHINELKEKIHQLEEEKSELEDELEESRDESLYFGILSAVFLLILIYIVCHYRI